MGVRWARAWLAGSLLVGAYTLVGYPVLVAALGRVRRRRIPSTPSAPPPPSVSLVIPAFNEEAVIGHKLENAFSLDYASEKLEIIVATDGSTDRTVDIVSGYASRGVRLSHDPRRRGKVSALNRAMPLATGDIVVISDANTLLDEPALRAIVGPFVDPEVGLVAGAKHIMTGDGALAASEGLYWKYESFIKLHESLLGSCLGVSGELLAVRRELFDPIPDGVVNDDTYLLMHVIESGYRSRYAPDARSYERVSETQADERERRARMVAGRLDVIFRRHRLPWRRPLLMWQFVSHKVLRAFLPLTMLSALVANVVAVATRERRRLDTGILAAQVGFYLLAAVGRRGSPAAGAGLNGRVRKALYIPTFLVESNAAALEGLGRFLLRNQSASWTRAARRPLDDR